MKKLSLVKIIAALVIVNCYMFTCGVMGTVGDAQMLTEDTSEEHSETAAPAGDIDQAEGQGTLDFLVPDETGTGVVQINLLIEIFPLFGRQQVIPVEITFTGQTLTAG